MAKVRFRSRRTWKKVLAVSLSLAMAAGAIFGLVSLSKSMKEDKKTIRPSYAIGAIDETTGKADDDVKTSVYTKNAFDAKGLEVELDLDAQVTYQVFWYNNVGEFKYASEEMTQGAQFYTPADCKVRIEITPILGVDDADEEIDFFSKYTYTNQITIRVDKNQTLTAKDFTEYNLADSMFAAHDGNVTFSTNGAASYDESDSTTFTFTNDGRFSAVYVKGFQLAEGNTGLHVRLKDGTVISYYSSNPTLGNAITEKSLPMTAQDAILLPKGATLFVTGLFGEVDTDASPANTVLCFY